MAGGDSGIKAAAPSPPPPTRTWFIKSWGKGGEYAQGLSVNDTVQQYVVPKEVGST